ncbi:MAG: SDR family oxidoreductase [Cytophagales bacterium]|nr:SDR family oxidoreductase [Cytophagales bacterium]
MKLQNQTAIITGATSGMGAAIAKLFAREGARVVVNGRNPERGEKVASEIQEENGSAVFVPSDISAGEGNSLLVEETLKAFGGIDIVVANAGFLGLGRITEISAETWHKTMDTNLNSIYYLLRSAIPEMQKQPRGNIIVNGSIAAFKSFPNHAAYCASKGALVPLIKQIAMDYGPHIRANLICPGPIDTPLIRDSAKAFPDPDRAVADAADATLLKRLGTPEDVAGAALFLASDDSSFITGASITVDGGIMSK